MLNDTDQLQMPLKARRKSIFTVEKMRRKSTAEQTMTSSPPPQNVTARQLTVAANRSNNDSNQLRPPATTVAPRLQRKRILCEGSAEKSRIAESAQRKRNASTIEPEKLLDKRAKPVNFKVPSPVKFNATTNIYSAPHDVTSTTPTNNQDHQLSSTVYQSINAMNNTNPLPSMPDLNEIPIRLPVPRIPDETAMEMKAETSFQSFMQKIVDYISLEGRKYFANTMDMMKPGEELRMLQAAHKEHIESLDVAHKNHIASMEAAHKNEMDSFKQAYCQNLSEVKREMEMDHGRKIAELQRKLDAYQK